MNDALAAAAVAERLRADELVPDGAFDRFLPPPLRAVAKQHWTPLVVARTIARWIMELRIGSVVDVGSGAGKFCVATALAATDCRFTGIEQRPWLVDTARELAAKFSVADRTHFITGRLGELVVPQAAAYYLFNPFGENVFREDGRIADDVEMSDERYQKDIGRAARLLASRPSGTYVIEYNGYGGKMPRGYEIVRRDRFTPNLLKVWRRG